MPDPSAKTPSSGDGRKFTWMPTLDGYILRAFLVPFGILLFAFTLLFIIMDMYNEIGDFLDSKAPLSVCVRFFALKIPGNIRFILPITVLLACMYALANLGRNRELTAIRASGISLMRCGLPIFTVGFCVMLVNFYFNERLVPETTRKAEIVKEMLDNPNYVEQTNARLQYHSGDLLRKWYFGQFNDDGYQEKVSLKFFYPHREDALGVKDSRKEVQIPREEASGNQANHGEKLTKNYWPIFTIQAEKTQFIQGDDDTPGFWEFNKAKIYKYNKDIAGAPGKWSEPKTLTVKEVIDSFAEYGSSVDCVISEAPPQKDVSEEEAELLKQTTALQMTLTPSEKDEPRLIVKGSIPFSTDELSEMQVGPKEEDDLYNIMNQRRYCFTALLVSEEIIPDKPSVIIKSVIEPDALSSLEICRILRDNPNMAKNLRCIYSTILFNRLAFPWACFLCAFFALPLATRNERSGIFSAIALAVGIAVLYQVLDEIFMVVGKNGYLSIDFVTNLLHFDPGPVIAGLAPTFIFGSYGIYLLKKSG